MLKIGIVGNNYCASYVSLINKASYLKLSGVFDPSYQFENPKNIDAELVYSSFADLVRKSDAIAFASPEKIYLPLIELALKYSKPVFLHSVHNLSYTEQIGLLKLHEEANEVLQIQQPIIFHDTFAEYQKICNNPLLLQYNYADCDERKILLKTRSIIGAIFSLFKSNIKKITANTIAVCKEVPDVIKIRLDFDNGSMAEIMVNIVENLKVNHLKCFEYNGYFNLDLITNTFQGNKNNQDISIQANAEKNNSINILEKQLADFYSNVRNYKSPLNNIEKEIITQEVVEKIKEKLRISINIF